MINRKVSISTHPAKDDILKYLREFEVAGADYLHCDIMDGKFVNDKTFSYKMVKEISLNTTLPLDVHLMVENPTTLIDNYIESGASFITVHYESYDNKAQLLKDISYIKNNNVLAGICISPKTSVAAIINVIPLIDIVLVMSVTPGESGQKFIETTTKKIKQLNDFRKVEKLNFLIEVDGGINPETVEEVWKNGADIVVSGSYIYNSNSYKKAISNLKI